MGYLPGAGEGAGERRPPRERCGSVPSSAGPRSRPGRPDGPPPRSPDAVVSRCGRWVQVGHAGGAERQVGRFRPVAREPGGEPEERAIEVGGGEGEAADQGRDNEPPGAR